MLLEGTMDLIIIIIIILCSVLLPFFTVEGMDRCEDWYASDDNLRGIPCGTWKKPNVGR